MGISLRADATTLEQKCISVDTRDTLKLRFRLLKVTLFSSLLPGLLIYRLRWQIKCVLTIRTLQEREMYMNYITYIQYTMPGGWSPGRNPGFDRTYAVKSG